MEITRPNDVSRLFAYWFWRARTKNQKGGSGFISSESGSERTSDLRVGGSNPSGRAHCDAGHRELGSKYIYSSARTSPCLVIVAK